MAFVNSFSCSQYIGQPSVIVLTDTSTGTPDGTLTERRVYLEKYDGTFLVPAGTTTDYIVWPIADDTISIDVLDKDYALNVRVDFEGTPPPIPTTDLFLWVEGDTGVTGTTSVTLWADAGSGGNDLVSESGKEPSLELNVLNGYPVIKNAAGTVAKMATAANFPTGDITLFLVASQDETTAPLGDTGGVFVGSDSDGMLLSRSANLDRVDAVSGANLLHINIVNGTFYTITYTVSGSTRTLAVNNGTPLSDTLSPPGGTGVLNVFDDGYGDYGNKRFAAIIAYSAILDADDILQVQDYLQTKYAHF